MNEAELRERTLALDPQTVAEKVLEVLSAQDAAARSLGVIVEGIGPGTAKLSMKVRDDMLNGFKTCHGGYITALADTAFAYSCNSHNEMSVASGISLDFVAPGRSGDILRAEAREISATARTGVYDITVTNQKGELIAVMRGKSHRFKGRPVVNLL